ncbi:MAG: hypothetical protein HOV81_26145 [Kofleriaceae bacterium]|nr:hypothetical protein [Kofleriaceae bacterium]
MPWSLVAGLVAGAAFLAGRSLFRKQSQESAAHASGLEPAGDLSHLPVTLQHTALWALADGGFERRVVHGRLAREAGDVDVTAFDLETLREHRGEWAWLPLDPPFRIGGVVSVVVCEVEREFPHVLLKRAGRGDEMIDDNRIERLGSLTKNVRDRLGMARSYESELPKDLPKEPAAVTLPDHWRAYTAAPDLVETLLPAGLRDALDRASRRDLVVELLGRLVVVYPAARDVVGSDAFADLTTTALIVVDGVLASSAPLTPRGVDVTTS